MQGQLSNDHSMRVGSVVKTTTMHPALVVTSRYVGPTPVSDRVLS